MGRSKRIRKLKMVHKRLRQIHRYLTRFDRAAKKCAGIIDKQIRRSAMIHPEIRKMYEKSNTVINR